MDQNDKISIIVPIYNSENYLKECISSIINQTYKNIEIILIDDGSTDNTAKMCKDYKDNDDRITLVTNSQNFGIAYCRNLGINKATSEYIMFVDSDDYLEKNMVKRLFELKKKHNADIAMCMFNHVPQEDDSYFYKDNFGEMILESDEKFSLLYDKNIDKKLCSVVIWNKLYNKEIFEGIRYPDGMIHEDEMVAHLILDKAKKIVFTKERLYNYRKREGSITNSAYKVERQDILDALIARYNFFKDKKMEKLASYTLKNYCFFIIKHYKCSIDNKLPNSVIDGLMSKLKNIFRELLLDRYIHLQTKLMILLFYYMPNFVIKIVFRAKNLKL